MNAVCEVFRRQGDVNDYGWDIETGSLTLMDWESHEVTRPDVYLLYRGPARLAPNQDWRARVQATRGDHAIKHESRVQVPIRTCPPVHANDLVRVLESPPDMELTHYLLHVRNMMMGSSAWIRNLLCDLDVAHPQLLPPPYEMPVSDPATLPHPEGCGCG